MRSWDAGGIRVGSPRGAFVRSEVCDKIKIARGGPTHQKFSWISSSAAASQMVGPITSSSSISVDMSCVSRAGGLCARSSFFPGLTGVFYWKGRHRESRGNLVARAGKRTDSALRSPLPVRAMSAGMPPKARLKAMLKRPSPSVHERDREEDEIQRPMPEASDEEWRHPHTKNEMGRARLTMLKWGETGKRKRREPARARARRGELRVSIPSNPFSATPITILSSA